MIRINSLVRFIFVSLAFVLLVTTVPAFAQTTSEPAPKIVGGTEAIRGSWPFMAALVYKGYSLSNGQFCGGSLIASKWVITAAHCAAATSASNITVALGIHNLGTDQGERINVKRSIMHPNYNSANQDYDVALLELESASSMTPIGFMTGTDSLTGLLATAVGWGLTNPNNSASASNVLRQVTMPIISNATCKLSYGLSVTDRMLCAGVSSGGKDSCQGDSGGPLVISSGGSWKLSGIVSWGNGCAVRGYYGVYGRVTEFTSFITSHVPQSTGTTGSGSGTSTGGIGTVPTGSGTGTGTGSTGGTTGTSGSSGTSGSGTSGTSGTSGGISAGGVSSGGSSTSLASSAVTQGLTLPLGMVGPYGLWNGFLRMVNILELENTSSSAAAADIYLVTSSGVPASRLSINIPANSKQDVILNELPGFVADAYGVVKVVGSLGGRIFYYRPKGSAFSDFEFAFGVALQEAMTTSSFVNFNTNQPSLAAEDQGNLVANWLSVVNFSATQKSFTVLKYDQSGAVIASTSIRVDPYGRVDLDGGHVVPGPASVGLIEVIPEDGGEYIAQLMRYGYAKDGGFDFAFPLNALAASGQATAVPLSTMSESQNWLELSNTSNVHSVFNLDFYNQQGELSSNQIIALDSRAQRHFNVNSIIGDSGIGHVLITPESSGSSIAASMYYFRSTSSGKVLSMYGSCARTPFSRAELGTYNLFLEMSNYLKLSNAGTSSASIELVVLSGSSEIGRTSIDLLAHTSIDVPLHDSARFGTTKDTYGTVNITPQAGTSVIGEILRLRYASTGADLEYVAPTDLR